MTASSSISWFLLLPLIFLKKSTRVIPLKYETDHSIICSGPPMPFHCTQNKRYSSKEDLRCCLLLQPTQAGPSWGLCAGCLLGLATYSPPQTQAWLLALPRVSSNTTSSARASLVSQVLSPPKVISPTYLILAPQLTSLILGTVYFTNVFCLPRSPHHYNAGSRRAGILSILFTLISQCLEQRAE